MTATAACRHLFVAKYLSIPKPTYCSYCSELLWVFQGKHMLCTRCGVFMHRACHAEVVRNIDQQARSIEQESVLVADPRATATRVSEGTREVFDVVDADEAVEPAVSGFLQHKHEFIRKTFVLPAKCDVCELLMGLGSRGFQCEECDFDCHDGCLITLDGSSYVVLDERAESTDPHKEGIVTDTLSLLEQYHRRNPHWTHTAFNPVELHTLYSRHEKVFEDCCRQLKEASLSPTDHHELCEALRFATAVYGAAYKQGYMSSCFLNGVMRLVRQDLLEAKDEVNNAAVAEILALPRSAIKFSKWSYKAMEASYAIITDKSASVVVLAFRGSLSDADFLTDACGQLAPFCDGAGHMGMVSMIERVFDESNGGPDAPLLRIIKEQLAAHPTFALWVAGHSLGAGLAQLFTVKALHTQVFGSSKLRCFAFAPPPVMTVPLADRFDESITCLVGGTDVVCRLQLNTVDRMASEMSSCTALATTEPADLTEELSLAGKIFMLSKPMSKHHNWMLVVPRGHVVLHHLFVHKDMISNHLMDHYSRGLRHIHVRDELVTS